MHRGPNIDDEEEVDGTAGTAIGIAAGSRARVRRQPTLATAITQMARAQDEDAEIVADLEVQGTEKPTGTAAAAFCDWLLSLSEPVVVVAAAEGNPYVQFLH